MIAAGRPPDGTESRLRLEYAVGLLDQTGGTSRAGGGGAQFFAPCGRGRIRADMVGAVFAGARSVTAGAAGGQEAVRRPGGEDRNPPRWIGTDLQGSARS